MRPLEDDSDRLLDLAAAFSEKYRAQPDGPACLSLALVKQGLYGQALAAVGQALPWSGLGPDHRYRSAYQCVHAAA